MGGSKRWDGPVESVCSGWMNLHCDRKAASLSNSSSNSVVAISEIRSPQSIIDDDLEEFYSLTEKKNR